MLGRLESGGRVGCVNSSQKVWTIWWLQFTEESDAICTWAKFCKPRQGLLLISLTPWDKLFSPCPSAKSPQSSTNTVNMGLTTLYCHDLIMCPFPLPVCMFLKTGTNIECMVLPDWALSQLSIPKLARMRLKRLSSSSSSQCEIPISVEK